MVAAHDASVLLGERTVVLSVYILVIFPNYFVRLHYLKSVGLG